MPNLRSLAETAFPPIARRLARRAGVLLGCLVLLRPCGARATAVLTVIQMPAAFVADNATESAVYASILDGYPNNVYAIKGTFSDGDLPYYGLTYVPATTMWAPQIASWDTGQLRLQTDANGEWRGWLYVRLEATAPAGDIYFRVSAIPLSPVSNPGPTVGAWQPCQGLRAATGGWLAGHAYSDPACTVPADRLIVRAMDAGGRVLGEYVTQNSRVVDGEDHADTGFFRLGVPAGTVASLTARTLENAPAAVYTRSAGPWRIAAGQTASVDVRPPGDANGDGSITLADCILVLRLASGLSAASPDGLERADVCPDGVVSLDDAAAVARLAFG